jgi:hypothetical protein
MTISDVLVLVCVPKPTVAVVAYAAQVSSVAYQQSATIIDIPSFKLEIPFLSKYAPVWFITNGHH